MGLNMQDYNFNDEILPVGQPPIETSNLTRFRGFINLITDSNTRSPTMGAVTGFAGIGKTVAIQAYLQNLSPRSHTILPAAIKVTVKPNSTPKALAIDIVRALQDQPRGHTIFDVADEAAAAILRNDLKLLFIDEADRLKEGSFDVVRHLYDSTGCPIVVVGLPHILSVIDSQDKFASRVGIRMAFNPLNIEEVLGILMPQLVITGWKFDPDKDTDREMGKLIWDMVSPSLRKLRNLLERASTLTRAKGTEWITAETIANAFPWTATSFDKKRMDGKSDMATMGRGDISMERDSELRQEAKSKKR